MIRVREKVFRNSPGFRFNVCLVDCMSVLVKSVLEQFLRAVNISRTNALQTKPKDCNDIVPFVVTYNTALPRISNIPRKHFNTLHSSTVAKTSLSNPLLLLTDVALIFVTF